MVIVTYTNGKTRKFAGANSIVTRHKLRTVEIYKNAEEHPYRQGELVITLNLDCVLSVE